jgi:hypothetical protein
LLADKGDEGEVSMRIGAIQSSPTAQNEAAGKAAPRPNPAPQQQASIPQDRVTISPQAHAQVQTASADKHHHGDKK